VLIVSLAGSAASFVLLGLGAQAGWLWLLFVSRILDGLTGGNVSVAQAYAADITTAENRARAMGMIGAAFGLGMVAGPAIGAGLSLGFWSPMVGPLFGGLPAYGAAAITLVALVLCHRGLPEPERSESRVIGPDLFHPGRLLRMFSRPDTGAILALYFIAMCAWAGLETYYVWLAEDRIAFDGVSRDVGIFLLFAFIGLMITLVQGGLVGRLARRFGEPALVAVGLVGMAASFVLLAEAGGWLLILHGTFWITVSQGLFGPSSTSLISRLSAGREQGGNLGVTQSIGATARIVGPLLFGVMYDISRLEAWTAGRLPFLVGGAVLAISAVGAFAMLGPLRRKLGERAAQGEASAAIPPKF
jgi:DHA1 family tetracycline resistance protein-like MFS transporter